MLHAATTPTTAKAGLHSPRHDHLAGQSRVKTPPPRPLPRNLLEGGRGVRHSCIAQRTPYLEIGADLIPRYGEHLLYSERERDRKKTSSNGTQKREAKKMKKIQKEKNEAKMFEEALGRMGLDFDSEAHVCI